MHWKTILTLTLLTILGGFGVHCIWSATAMGIAISPDSTAYLGAARSLLAGQGVTAFGKPLTHFPPLLSVMLAIGGLFGPDPVVVARWLNAMLLGANVFLMGYAIHRSTGAVLTALLGGALVLAAADIVEVHKWAWSEPTMLCFGLAGLVLLSTYFEDQRFWRLSAAAGCLGAALLTRYAAAPLIGTALLGIVLFRPGRFFGRLKDAGVFALISCGPFGLWLVRNRLVGGTPANWTFSQHWIPERKILKAQATVAQWFDVGTGEMTRGRQTTILWTALGILVALVAVLIWKTVRPNRDAAGLPQVPRLPWLLLIFGTSYFAFLVLAISFFDFTIITPLNARLLSPLHFALIGFGVMVLHAGCASYPWSRWTAGVALLLVGGWSVWAQDCHCDPAKYPEKVRNPRGRYRIFVPPTPTEPNTGTLAPP